MRVNLSASVPDYLEQKLQLDIYDITAWIRRSLILLGIQSLASVITMVFQLLGRTCNFSASAMSVEGRDYEFVLISYRYKN